jgi:hypothetical protein
LQLRPKHGHLSLCFQTVKAFLKVLGGSIFARQLRTKGAELCGYG